MITKLILPQSFSFDGPAASLVPLHRVGGADSQWLRKHASHGVFHDLLRDLKPIPGKSVIHVLAVGDEELWGPNRNGDGFSREDNVTAHRTFKDIGHVFRHHQNDDPFKAVGDIIATAHNENMSRIELLLGLDNTKCRREIEKVDNDEDLPVSMGCFTAGHFLTLEDGSVIRLEDAVEGQQVLTHLGNRLPITHVFNQDPYTGTLYTLKARTVEDVEATAEHPFFVVRQEHIVHTGRKTRRVDPSKLNQLDVTLDADWVAAKDLRVGDYLVTPVNLEEELPDYIPRTDTPVLARHTTKACRDLETTHRGGSRLRVDDFILTPIRDILSRDVVDEPVYNIEVQSDNSYVINGIAVHNSLQDFDVCSHCGHKAPTASDHCEHIKKMLGQVLEDGTKIYMKNPKPKYFDLSLVFKPADRIAYTLRKVAAAGGEVIGGHELADMVGLVDWTHPKMAAKRTLAAMYKEIPMTIRQVTRPKDVHPNVAAELKKQANLHGIDQLLGFLHSNGWLLSPRDFAEVIGHPEPEKCEMAVAKHDGMDDFLDDHSEVKSLEVPVIQDPMTLSGRALEELEGACSMHPDKVQKRVISITVTGPSEKTAQIEDTAEAKGLAALYNHYKVAFAMQFQSRNDILRNVAATF